MGILCGSKTGDFFFCSTDFFFHGQVFVFAEGPFQNRGNLRNGGQFPSLKMVSMRSGRPICAPSNLWSNSVILTVQSPRWQLSFTQPPAQLICVHFMQMPGYCQQPHTAVNLEHQVWISQLSDSSCSTFAQLENNGLFIDSFSSQYSISLCAPTTSYTVIRHTCKHAYMHTHVHTHTHTDSYIHTHTHSIYTQIYMC